MAKKVIDVGVAYGDVVEPIRDGFGKCNDNFTELYDVPANPVSFTSFMGLGAIGSNIYITSGLLTPIKSIHAVNGEGDVADDLVNIATTGIPNGTLLVLQGNPYHDITITQGGNIKIKGAATTYTLNMDPIVLVLIATTWDQIA